MRFRDMRQVIVKGSAADCTPAEPRITLPDGASVVAATPRRLSESNPEAPDDVVPQPAHNRASRRAAGRVRTRPRLDGVALHEKPWHTDEKENT